MKVLITGGAGFIGSHTADELIKQGHSVRILDLLDPQIHGEQASFPDYLHNDVEAIYGDICNAEDILRALDEVEIVYHFAALTGVGQSMYDISNYVKTNCLGTAILLETIVKKKLPIKKVVLASSRAVYGEGTHECEHHGTIYPSVRMRDNLEKGIFHNLCPHCSAKLRSISTTEDRTLDPLSVYAETKKHQEDYCKYVAKTFGLPITILRYFNVYGSRQSLSNPYTGVVSIFYNRMVAEQPISLYERGMPIRDFIHVSDVCKANLLALNDQLGLFNVFNIGSGEQSTIKDVACALADACDSNVEMKDLGEFRQGDIYSCYADLKKSSENLGFYPNISLNQGMQEFFDWAQNQEAVDNYQKTVTELKQFGLFGRAESS